MGEVVGASELKEELKDDAAEGDVKQAEASEEEEEISYPLTIIYCENCGLPPEYCEYYPDYEKCQKLRNVNLPAELEKVSLGRQKRGGKGLVKPKKKSPAGAQRICVSRSLRGKKKFVTVVTGLATFSIDLKVAAKSFGSKFACGSSVTGDDEIVIQGDVVSELFDYLPEKWPQISEDAIDDLGDQKR